MKTQHCGYDGCASSQTFTKHKGVPLCKEHWKEIAKYFNIKLDRKGYKKMTNFDKWMLYTSRLPSPDNFIRWSWYYTIAAALQRRVWIGSGHQACYPNMYCILVGPPGVGKGLVLKEVSNMLKHWTLDMSKGNEKIATTEENKAVIESSVAANLKNATSVEFQGNSKGAKDTIKPLLIPVCADSITCEALIKVIGDNYRYVNYIEEAAGVRKVKAYGHSSVCFILPELSSLMKKNTQNTNNFLLSIYDCPIDHEYISITRGKDRIRRGCLNIIAGTTPSFMQTTFSEDLIGEGFSSRTHYIFATKNRFNKMFLSAPTPEQEKARDELLAHIKKLTTLYGNVRISQTTHEWLEEWWDGYCNEVIPKNKHPEMIPHEARMQLHVMKLAMAMHFSEDAEQDENGCPANEIPVETFKRAIDFIMKEKPNMHLALILEGKHPISRASQKILEMLQSGKKNFVDIYIQVSKLCNRVELEEALAFLETTNQLVTEETTDTTTGDPVVFYTKKD